MKKKSNAAGTVGFIFIAMLMAKVLGQVREMVIAYSFGTAWQADAYVAASQIPTNFFDMILGSAVSAAFIPVFNKFMEKEGEGRARRFAGAFLNLIIIISAALSVIGIVFASQIIAVFTPGLGSEAAVLAAKLLKIMFPMVIFIGGAYTFVGILQSMGEYNLPAVMSMVSSGTCIIYLLTLEDKFGISGLAVSLLLGWMLQFLILLPSVLKKGLRPTAHICDSGFCDVAKLALPVLIGTWVQPVNVMVNTWIASSIPGGVSAINYSNRLYLIAAGVFAMSVTNYIFPKLSRLSIDEADKESWLNMFLSSLKTVLLVVTPMAVVFLTESKEIIRVIYQRGEFDETSVAVTGGALLFYSIGILPYALQEVMYKAFYSKRKSVVPMFVAMSGIVVNIILSFTLSGIMGINGLALAASMSVAITAVISFFILTKNSGKVGRFLAGTVKIVISAVASAAIILLVKPLMINFIGLDSFVSRTVVTCVSAVAGCTVYGLLTLILRIPEVTGMVKMLLKKGETHEK